MSTALIAIAIVLGGAALFGGVVALRPRSQSNNDNRSDGDWGTISGSSGDVGHHNDSGFSSGDASGSGGGDGGGAAH